MCSRVCSVFSATLLLLFVLFPLPTLCAQHWGSEDINPAHIWVDAYRSILEEWPWKLAVVLLSYFLLTIVCEKLNGFASFRLMPWKTSAIFVACVVGMAMCECSAKIVRGVLMSAGLKASVYEQIVKLLLPCCMLILISNCLAVLLSFFTSKVLRDGDCLGRADGRVFGRLLQLPLWGTFLMLLALSHVFFVAFFLVHVGSHVCLAGDSAVNDVLHLVSEINQHGGIHLSKVLGDIDVQSFCSYLKSHEDVWNTWLLFACGCVVSLSCQAGMIACLAADRDRINDERMKHKQEDDMTAVWFLTGSQQGVAPLTIPNHQQ